MLIMQLLRDNLTVGFYWHRFLNLTFTSHNLLLMANMVKVSILTPQSLTISSLGCLGNSLRKNQKRGLNRPSSYENTQSISFLIFFFYFFSSNISLNIDFYFFDKDPV